MGQLRARGRRHACHWLYEPACLLPVRSKRLLSGSVSLFDWIRRLLWSSLPGWLFWSGLPERLLLWLGWLLRAAGDLVGIGLWSWNQIRVLTRVPVGIQPPFCCPERRFIMYIDKR